MVDFNERGPNLEPLLCSQAAACTPKIHSLLVKGVTR